MLAEIKKLAKANQHGPAKIMSKDLVRMRNQISQYYVMSSQLKAISMRLSTAEINASMVDALKGVNKVMSKVNAEMDIQSIRECLKEFTKESAKMEMQQEMMGDAMDSAMDQGNEEEEADSVYQNICEQIGIDINDDQNVVGKGQIQSNQPVAQTNQKDEQYDDLQARLDQLKR